MPRATSSRFTFNNGFAIELEKDLWRVSSCGRVIHVHGHRGDARDAAYELSRSLTAEVEAMELAAKEPRKKNAKS
jgi:hypothetical protein